MEERELLQKLYVEQGMRTKDIAPIMGVHQQTVTRKIKKYGMTRPLGSENRKHEVNDTWFDEIDTKEKAYLLGLICSDGWVAKSYKSGCPSVLGFCFQKKDEEFLDFIESQLGKSTRRKTDKYVYLSYVCKRMVSVLFDYSIVPNKSLTISLEDVINKTNMERGLIPSFLLGCFDGDGCISSTKHTKCPSTIMWRCSFTGTLETCEFLKEYFGEGFIVDEKAKSGKTFSYVVSGINKVVKVLDCLYSSHDSFCLSRKKEKFEICCLQKSH